MNQHPQYAVTITPFSSIGSSNHHDNNLTIAGNGHYQQQFHPTTSGCDSSSSDHSHHYQQQQLSTSTTMIHQQSPSSPPLLLKNQQQQQQSVSTCHQGDASLSMLNNVGQSHSCLNVNNVSSTLPQTTIPSSSISSTCTNQQQQSTFYNNNNHLTINAPSPSSHCFGLSLSPFSFNNNNGGAGSLRDRAISSPPPLAHMKKHKLSNSALNTNNPSPNHSGASSPNCSDQMNVDDDCCCGGGIGTDQTFEERPRRFSLPSNDLINMPFFRQKPQNLTIFQLFNPETPINEPEIDLKDITGMTVLSNSDCKEQYEMLVEELKEFNVYFGSCDKIVD